MILKNIIILSFFPLDKNIKFGKYVGEAFTFVIKNFYKINLNNFKNK